MKLRAYLARSPMVPTLLLFTLAVLTGWGVFNLQLVSIVRLLQEAGISSLPGLMTLQAALSYGLLRIWGNAALDSTNRFFYTALLIGLFVTVVAHVPGVSSFAAESGFWQIYGLLFIMSQLSIAALRMGIHVTFSRIISVLRNPQVSTQLAIAEEAGFLVGILLLLCAPIQMGAFSIVVSGLPFILGGIVLSILRWRNSRDNRDQARFDVLAAKSRDVSVVRHKSRKPYLSGLIALFTVVSCLKAVQWFGMAWGLAEASKSSGQLVSLFSKMSLFQSLMTLSILFASLKFSSKIPTWGFGLKILIGFQVVIFGVLAIFPGPYFFIAGEVVRKVMEHGFLGRSLQLMTSVIPDEDRLEIRHLMERWSTTSGVALAGAGAALVVFANFPLYILAAGGLLMACLGLRLRQQLFTTLSDFHLARLRQPALNDVIQAAYALADPECNYHHAALTGLLERNPRPIITKSLLHALGIMRHSSALPTLRSFVNSDREDIQRTAVSALRRFRGHEINMILLKILRDLIRSENSIRISVVRLITERLGRLAVPYLLELLEVATGERVKANAIEILGEIARAERDEGLMEFLARYLVSAEPRRVRANAVVVLYSHRKYWTQAFEALDRMLTSQDPLELDSFAYVAGELRLRGHEGFLWQRSMELDHLNSTLLVALLKLDNPRAASLIAEAIVSKDQVHANALLVRVSAVKVNIRAKVFYELVAGWPSKLDEVLLKMRQSQRDFDQDRKLIRQEARRVGITLTEEEAWSNEKSTLGPAAIKKSA